MTLIIFHFILQYRSWHRVLLVPEKPLGLALLFYSPLPLTSSDYLIPRYKPLKPGLLVGTFTLHQSTLQNVGYFRGRTPYYRPGESSEGFPPKFPSAPHHASLSCLLPQITAALNSVRELTVCRRRTRWRKEPRKRPTWIFPSSFFHTVFSFSQHMTSATTR